VRVRLKFIESLSRLWYRKPKPMPDIYELVEEINRRVKRLEDQERDDQKTLAAIAAGVNLLLADIQPPPRAARLTVTWDQGEPSMPVTIQPGESRGGTVSPLTAAGAASPATLSGLSASFSDPTFTVVPDPASPNTRIIVTAPTSLPSGLTTDAATVTFSATATEPDGVTTESISGVDTVTVNAVVPPPPAPAASLGIVWDPAPSQRKR